MLVEQIWAANNWRNFHYLVACEETGEALAIDPLEWQKVLGVARAHGLTITQILNTHDHGDHTAGNEPLRAATGAKVLAHAGAAKKIGNVDRGLGAGDTVKVGRTVELECLDTPGHTLAHICVVAHAPQEALFSGDTLFNAGAGNCHNGGDPALLYDTFAQQLERLPLASKLYPGHEYLARNLEFTIDREPHNAAARTLLERVRNQDPARPYVTTLGEERDINSFFRLGSEDIVNGLRESFPGMPSHPDPKTVFLKLRELRNQW